MPPSPGGDRPPRTPPGGQGQAAPAAGRSADAAASAGPVPLPRSFAEALRRSSPAAAAVDAAAADDAAAAAAADDAAAVPRARVHPAQSAREGEVCRDFNFRRAGCRRVQCRFVHRLLPVCPAFQRGRCRDVRCPNRHPRPGQTARTTTAPARRSQGVQAAGPFADDDLPEGPLLPQVLAARREVRRAQERAEELEAQLLREFNSWAPTPVEALCLVCGRLSTTAGEEAQHRARHRKDAVTQGRDSLVVAHVAVGDGGLRHMRELCLTSRHAEACLPELLWILARIRSCAWDRAAPCSWLERARSSVSRSRRFFRFSVAEADDHTFCPRPSYWVRACMTSWIFSRTDSYVARRGSARDAWTVSSCCHVRRGPRASDTRAGRCVPPSSAAAMCAIPVTGCPRPNWRWQYAFGWGCQLRPRQGSAASAGTGRPTSSARTPKRVSAAAAGRACTTRFGTLSPTSHVEGCWAPRSSEPAAAEPGGAAAAYAVAVKERVYNRIIANEPDPREWRAVPLVVDTFGAWCPGAITELRHIARANALREDRTASAACQDLFHRLSFSIAQGVARIVIASGGARPDEANPP
ncbi:hypothetical protein DIPPA_30975 [Diplonema papillatum]|nr:hypothetical protein DIPPA_30975 [Diplonema papillatum]